MSQSPWPIDGVVEPLTITEPVTIVPGVTARPTHRDIVSVAVHYSADPVGIDQEKLNREKRRQGCIQRADGSWKLSWKWRKEMELDWLAQSGRPVFASDAIAAQRENLIEPILRLGWTMEQHGERRVAVLTVDDEGPIRVYAEPDAETEYSGDITDAVRSVAIGMDVSEGVGASDSTIVGLFGDTREQAFEMASATISQADLGRVAVALARWYNQALICCVRPMAVTVLRTMADEQGYSRLWRHKLADRMHVKEAAQLGWAKGEASSHHLFPSYKDALERGAVTIRSATLLAQHEQYIYDEHGRITQQALVHLPPDVRQKHGDLVVGMALANQAANDLPAYAEIKEYALPGRWSAEWFELREQRRAAREARTNRRRGRL